MPQSLASRTIRAAAVVLLAATVAACQTVQTTAPGEVGVDRRQRMLVSEAQVQEAAAEAYRQELEKARSAGRLNSDAQLTARVRGISQRLIPQTATFRPDAPRWNWEINVTQSDQMNAWVMPGGKIMVYSGLVQKLELTDAEIAAVIGHEIAHALREHTRERMSRAYAQQAVLAGVATIAGVGQGVFELANQVATVTFQLPHGREQEAEADRIGLELMARAGFDPNAAVSIWRKMEAQGGRSPPQWLSTHPSTGDRIRDLQARVPTVMPLYEAARR